MTLYLDGFQVMILFVSVLLVNHLIQVSISRRPPFGLGHMLTEVISSIVNQIILLENFQLRYT